MKLLLLALALPSCGAARTLRRRLTAEQEAIVKDAPADVPLDVVE